MVKQLFETNNKVMIRIPTLPEKSLDDEELSALCKDKVFREQVLVSSKKLYDQINIYLEDPTQMSKKKLKGFKQSIIKYVLRRRSRTTPFGLYSAVGIATFDSESNLQINRENIKRKARPDFEWLFGLVKKIEKEEHKRLVFQNNSAVYIKGDRAKILYSTDNDVDVESIKISPAFKIVSEVANKATPFENILRELQNNYPTVSSGKLENYLIQLIEKEYIISTLRPPLTVIDQFEYVITEYRNLISEDSIWQMLSEIKQKIESYNALALGEGEKLYLEIFSKMNDIYEGSSSLQVDSYLDDTEIKIPNEVQKNANEALSLLIKLAPKASQTYWYLSSYLEKFIDKYGVDREVSIVEMLDSNMGIGAPPTYNNPKNDYNQSEIIEVEENREFKNYFLSKYNNAIRNNTRIELHENELNKFLQPTIESKEIPTSFETYFIIKKMDERIKLYLGPNGGSDVAGKTIGRFSHLNEELKNLVEITNFKERSKKNKNVKTCELSFIPKNVRNANVTRNLSFREEELALFTMASKNNKKSLNISDILIGITNNQFYARNKNTGELLEFQANNMLNPQINNNIIRFLQEISICNRRKWSDMPWSRYYSDFMYIPEISYKNVVLSPEQWLINKYDLNFDNKLTFDEFTTNFLEFHSNFNLPEKFYYTEMDNRIPINPRDIDSLEILFKEFKKKNNLQQKILLQKMEEGENLIFDDNIENYVSEIVIPFFNKENEKDIKIPEKNIVVNESECRLKFPFDNWLFLKLYAEKSNENNIIGFEILDFCESLKKRTGINYFFMRYVDPQPHIRLRFNGDIHKLLEVYPEILRWVKELESDKKVSKIVIDTYEREVERYGGVSLVDLAENIFTVDSQAVQYLLRMNKTGDTDISLDYIGIISVIKFLSQFKLGIDEQLEFLNSYKNSKNYNDYFRVNKNKLLKLYEEFENANNFSDNSDVKILANILNSRSFVVEEYVAKYSEKNENLSENYLNINYLNIVASFIHLHCNRLFGIDQQQEEKIMSIVTQLLTTVKYKKGMDLIEAK